MTPEDLDFLRHLKKEENKNVALNLIKSFENRNLGHLKKNVKAKENLQLFAEEELVRKSDYDEQRCDMPGMPRSTFLMVFSPDGTKVASTHGNHNIYVTDLRSGKNIKILIGHPRTPWCIAFHPTSNQIVASGCLGGQVRIWDLSGGSEVWTASNQSVIASLAFHPNDRVLVIATINELHFWDWSKPEPFCHTATGNQKEKVRYVAFDKLGHKLITGISNSQNRWDYVRTSVPVSRQSERPASPYRRRITPTVTNYPLVTPRQASTSSSPREPLSSVPERERNITVCYRNLVREYGRLVQRYLQLYRPPAMIDRGTDPMEQNNAPRSSSSSTQSPESSSSTNQPGPSRTDEDNNTTTSEDPSSSNINPFQLLAPSRMLSPRMRPPLPVNNSQPSESRRKRVNRGKLDRNGKRLRLSTIPFEDSDDDTNQSESIDDGQPGPSSRPSPQPGPSRLAENDTETSDREQILEDIIKGSAFPDTNDTLDTSTPSTSNTASTNRTRLAAVSSNNSTSNVGTSTDNPQPTTSGSSTREELRKTVMAILYKSPKVSKATQKYSPNSGSDNASSSERSDNENQSRDKRVANEATEIQTNPEERRPDRQPATEEAGSSQTNSATTTVDPSRPGTSRNDIDTATGPREAQRLEVMMMNIRRNAEEKLRSRFLPLIRSVPENDRRELIRLFEQGVKESREKARLRYRNMGQMFTKKPNRRPILDTSTDTTSSEDEQNPLHMNFFNQSSSQNDRNNTSAGGSSGADRQQPNADSGARGSYHDINNLENWVTSLFDDIEPQNNASSEASTNVATTQTTTTTTTPAPTTIDSLLDRQSRTNRVQNMRRFYARVLRDRSHSINPSTASATSSGSVGPSSTNIRTTNSPIYSFSRRRLGTHRTSAFLPTGIYYPRTPPEFRRNRHVSFGRWRLNQRLYRSNNINSRPIPSPVLNNNSNFASDEVINFSERPNSEDDPVPTFDRRPSTPSPHFPYHFHPFNPPPDLPTINPENIGIGNMYSNIVQDLETSLNDVRNIRAANRPGEMSDMLSNFSERLENIMNQSETILRNLRTSVEMLPANEGSEAGEPTRSTPTVSFNDANFYVREHRTEGTDLERSIDNILDGNPLNNVTSDHTYPRNSDVPTSSSTTTDTMSPLMTSLHLTISHIQRQARLLRQQVESIERIDRAMVEVAQLQLMRLLLVELSRYVRNMSGESRSTCMSSVRQMMAGTRISDSSPGESASNDDNVQAPVPQPSTSNTSSNQSSLPPTRARGWAHKTYPPSRMSRLQRQFYRRTTFINHAPRRYALRLQPRNTPSLLTPSVSLGLDSQSVLNMYSRINTFTLSRMSRRLEELVNEQIRIFMQRSFVRVPPRTPGGNMGEQNLAIRLRDSITRTNRLVGNIFDANVVRNYRMDATAVSRDGVDRFYARQTLSFIIDGISSHLDETRGTSLSYNIRLQLQGVMTMSMLLSELLLLHIVDSIPPPTDMNLDQERQSLTSRIDQMCTTMMLSSRYGGFSTHLTHTLRQLQTMMRQNGNPPLPNPLGRRRASESRFRPVDVRPRSRSNNPFNRARHLLPSRAQERNDSSQALDTESPTNNEEYSQAGERTALENRIISLRRMRNSLYSLCYRMDNRASHNSEQRESQPNRTTQSTQETENRPTEENAELEQLNSDSADLRSRVLEARSRAFQRMQMMDRMRNSLRTLRNRFGEPEQGQNSESDDNTRQSEGGQRRQPQANSESNGDYSSWEEVRYVSRQPPSSERPNEANRNGNSQNSNESSFMFHPFRTSSPYRPTPALNSTAPSTSSNSEDWPGVSRWSWSNVPSVQVNDVPVSELGPSQDGPNTSSESDNAPSVGNNNNSYPNRGVMARLAAIRAVNHPLGVFRPRFLHPLYASVNPFDADLDDPQREHIYDSDVITTVTPNHRIQVWDISDSCVPVISNPLKNVVVSECKIHNDASVDVASDGSILVTLLPSGGYLNVTNRLGVYSLKWETLGQCLYTTNFDHNAVSVSLSPLARHLVVGLASRRVSIVPSERWMMARIFRIEQKDIPGDRLPVVRELEQSRDGRATSHKSVNCIRWLPTSGQGLIYATNTGQLVIWT